MRFELVQRLPGPPAAAIRLYADPAFHTSLTGLTKVDTPTLVDRTEVDDGASVRLHYRFIAHLPGAVTAVVDPDRLSWTEETLYRFGPMTATTVLHPDHYADKLTASLTSRFEADGAGTVRRVAGELKVRMLLVGGQVERAIVSGLEEHLAEESHQAAARLAAD